MLTDEDRQFSIQSNKQCSANSFSTSTGSVVARPLNLRIATGIMFFLFIYLEKVVFGTPK